MPAADAARLESLLAASIPYQQAPEELRWLATDAGNDIDPARLNARLGHDLGYYNGLAFGILADTPEGPLNSRITYCTGRAHSIN